MKLAIRLTARVVDAALYPAVVLRPVAALRRARAAADRLGTQLLDTHLDERLCRLSNQLSGKDA